MTLATKLKAYRKEAGLSQGALARESGLNFVTIWKIEHQRILSPRIDTLHKIMAVLRKHGVDPTELLT